MKRILLITIPAVLLLAIVYFYLAVPSILPTWFYTRHILIYILFSYFVLIGAYVLYRRLLIEDHRNNTSPWTIRSLVLLSTGLILFGGSQLQLYLIDVYEIPPVLGCVYYDDYGNLIYSSQYPGTCPEIEMTYTDSYDDDFYYREVQAEFTEIFEGRTPIFSFENELITRIEAVYEPIPRDRDLIEITQRSFTSIETMITETSVRRNHSDDNDPFTVFSHRIQMVENRFSGNYGGNQAGVLTSQMELTEYDFQITLDGVQYAAQIILPEAEELSPSKHQVLDVTMTENRNEGYCWHDDELTCFNYDILIEETLDEGTTEVFAEGMRSNTYQELRFRHESNPVTDTLYKTTYYGSRWSGQSEEYSSMTIYPNSNVIGYHYDDYTDPFRSTMFKEYYTDNTGILPQEASVLSFTQQDILYLIDGYRNIEVTDTDYGTKLTYYSTKRDGTGRYTIDSISGVKSYENLTTSIFLPTMMVQDAKAMLEDIATYKPIYVILQYNVLIYGISTPISVYT